MFLDFSQLDDGWSETPSRSAGTSNSLLISGVRVDFCWIPPGEFWMGSPKNEEGRDDDETRHRVVLTRGFWMESTPVTQEFWLATTGENPSYFQGKRDYFGGDLTLPVESVSWNDFQEFIARLNDLNVAPIGWRFALPTEAQWEYACRAGTNEALYGELDKIAWIWGNSAVDGNRTPHPVGQKKPNAWKLRDTIGNVWEWVADAYDEDFYNGGTRTDPFNAGSRDSPRVQRGGCYNALFVAACRAANRFRDAADRRCDYLGGRLILVPRE